MEEDMKEWKNMTWPEAEQAVADMPVCLLQMCIRDSYYSFFERRKYIVFKLFANSFITNYQICELFEISRNTCIADMTAISRFLRDNGFETRIVSNNKGYMLAGNEAEKMCIRDSLIAEKFRGLEQHVLSRIQCLLRLRF